MRVRCGCATVALTQPHRRTSALERQGTPALRLAEMSNQISIYTNGIIQLSYQVMPPEPPLNAAPCHAQAAGACAHMSAFKSIEWS